MKESLGSSTLGILAYGSLIRDPGPELAPLVVDRRFAATPFNVEFARKSRTRGWAPTLVPFTKGAPITATVLVLAAGTHLDEAEDMLFRRETRRHPPAEYPRNDPRDGPDDVTIQRHLGAAVDVLLSVSLPSNIDPSPQELARLAIASVTAPREAEDGISYLIGAKADGITTPVMPSYEAEILARTGARDLEEALSNVIQQRR